MMIRASANYSRPFCEARATRWGKRGEGREARRACATTKFSLVISDLKLPDGDGLDVQKWFAEKSRHPALRSS